MTRPVVGGVLLTGGESSRLGQDKTQLLVEGVTIARRTATLLSQFVTTAVEVGPGTSGLISLREKDPGSGPLGAICAGRALLEEHTVLGDALVMASDMPRLTSAILELLVHYDAPGSVLPLVNGVAQPLCARWSRADLVHATARFNRGERGLRWLLTRPHLTVLDESLWGHVATADDFADIDTPEDARRLGLAASLVIHPPK